MFSWKRQRKEEPEAAPPPGSSPTAVVAAASVSAASSDADEAAEPATPAASCGSSSVFAVAPSAAGPGSSIELAARGSGTGGAAVAATSRLPLVLERASVRTKAAYFEALIHSNTTAHVVCTAEGTQHCSYPSSSGGDVSMLQPAYSSGDAIMLQPDSSGDEDEQGGFSEVHMVLRMPRGQPRPAVSGRYGGVAEMEALIEALQGQLELKEQQRKAAVDAYARRTGECENLMRVVRELTESRSKAAMQRASLAERYNDLQQEYHRMLRIADLSRTVSKENMAKTSRTRSELRRVQSELHATKNHALSLNEKNTKVRVENALLKEKVTLLERLDFEDVQESEIKKHHTRYRMVETY